MKTKSKIITIIVSIIMIISSLIIIYRVIKNLKYIEGNPKYISYINKTVGDIRYNIRLKSNEFYEESYLDNNFSYVTALVEYIDTNFKYEFSTDNIKKLNYRYSIIANMLIENSDESNKLITKPILNKDYILLEEKIGKIDNSKFTINENLKIGIDYYNLFVSDFVNSLALSTSSKLDVKLLINIFDEKKDINTYHEIVMTIPLGVKIFDLDINKNFVDKEIVYNHMQQKPEYKYVTAIIYIISFIIINGLGYYIIKVLLNENKCKYILEKEKILKEYDDRIVTVINFVKLNKLQIIDIPSFRELLELSNETFEPIIYWERDLGKSKEAWFSILRNKIVYRYVISNKNIDNNGNM